MRIISTIFYLGAHDEAFKMIDQADFSHVFDPAAPPPGGWITESILFATGGDHPMVKDPRFIDYCKKLGLCEYWISSGRWPDVADDPSMPYDFRALASA